MCSCTTMSTRNQPFFIQLADNDHIYYTFVSMFEYNAVFNIGFYCDAIANNSLIFHFSAVTLLNDIIKYIQHKLLKNTDNDDIKEVKSMLTGIF